MDNTRNELWSLDVSRLCAHLRSPWQCVTKSGWLGDARYWQSLWTYRLGGLFHADVWADASDYIALARAKSRDEKCYQLALHLLAPTSGGYPLVGRYAYHAAALRAGPTYLEPVATWRQRDCRCPSLYVG